MTKAEWLLWLELRGRRIDGLRFRRQHPIGDYITDFACIARKVVVELDGDTHDTPHAQRYDARRTDYLNDQGWRVLRLHNDDIYASGEYAARRVRDFLRALP